MDMVFTLKMFKTSILFLT